LRLVDFIKWGEEVVIVETTQSADFPVFYDTYLKKGIEELCLARGEFQQEARQIHRSVVDTIVFVTKAHHPYPEA
jgi:hypothetical protein